MNIRNHRLVGESYKRFRTRRRNANAVIKQYLRAGVPATPRSVPGFGVHGMVEMEYVVGPHRSHKPHEVTVRVDVNPWTDAFGIVHSQKEFTVMHPGTLVKREKLSAHQVVEGLVQL